MKRGLVLGVIIAVGAFSMGVAAWQQQQAPPPSAQTLTVEKVKDNLFAIRGGASGGTTAVFVTSKGAVVVDTKNAGWGQPLLEKIKGVTDKPVTTIINTHSHGDHVSGNPDFPGTIDIIVQENAKANMVKEEPFTKNGGKGLPTKTFKDKLTIGKGADEIDLFFFGPGHTGGDAWVVFPALRTMHVGDMFAGKGIPLVDKDAGGSMLHFPDTLKKALAGVKNVDTLINGHTNAVTTWDDLKTFQGFILEFVAWAESELKAGKTPDQVAAEWTLPDRYKALSYSANASAMFGGLKGRIELLAEELKKK